MTETTKRLKAIQRFQRSRQKSDGTFRFNLRWYESWFMRAASFSLFIVLCSYAGSLLTSIQSIDSVARISFDPEISDTLDNHLKTIKELYVLKQANFKSKLLEVLRAEGFTDKSHITQTELIHALKLAGFGEFWDIDRATTQKYQGAKPQTSVEWLGPQDLYALGMAVSFPQNNSFENFKKAEELHQRYQLIGAALDSDIRPSLIRANVLILSGAFVIILFSFTILGRLFQNALGKILLGFSNWSERDPSFRFDSNWRGELRLITAQFNAMADEVEANRKRSLYLEKVASWQTIARKLAHEVKNPLTPIQMMISQLKRRYKGDDTDFGKLLDNAQEIINEEIGALRRMVDNFSEFARLPMPQFQKADLIPVLRKACDLQQAAFERHHIEMLAPDSKLFCEFDPDLLRQVIINLIKNAAEACGEQSSNILVSAYAKNSDRCEICVADNGPGIPTEIQRNIFEAYFTTKHSGPNSGMGLGLAVCQKIILDHHGELRVESKPGDTHFLISLPISQKEGAPT